jgi:hypothetical protein
MMGLVLRKSLNKLLRPSLGTLSPLLSPDHRQTVLRSVRSLLPNAVLPQAATPPTRVDGVCPEPLLAEIAELRGDGRFRVACELLDLSDSPPLSVLHRLVDVEYLTSKPRVITRPVVDGAVEVRADNRARTDGSLAKTVLADTTFRFPPLQNRHALYWFVKNKLSAMTPGTNERDAHWPHPSLARD